MTARVEQIRQLRCWCLSNFETLGRTSVPRAIGSPTVRDLRAVEVKVAIGCVAAILSAEGQRVASAQRLRKNAFCLLLRRALRSATVLHPINAKKARRRHTRFRKLGAIPSTPPPLSV